MNPPTWCQANVAFPDWERAETTALTRLAPLLLTAEDQGALRAWFIVRKHPCWRIRYLPGPGGQEHITGGLDQLIAEGCIKAWTEIIYEPESHAFGGDEAMASAHRLFHHDSRGLFNFLRTDAAKHRRETSLMLCSLMMRAAHLDWYEQGDVWARVAAHRRQEPDTAPREPGQLHAAVRRLVTVDPQYALQPNGPLAHAADWARAYLAAGAELARLNEAGHLHRGLRDVLAHHVIFAWNRIGLPYATQVALTTALKTVIFGLDPAERRAEDRVESP
ncbi:thiopeptide-type bacteriocin biosynthesis protein [Streptomyces luteolus]|uniref:Thiopeptide-type bacteriocin biosynthesis protein n=1 Tax=Streptomyces luteolus TaxID=3043615 RepID=A0ABT6T2Q6_9ACTN|nr:thiopeptide-type bacteriocin biosynthesis protein [Streptomyces sp. B-S-A12]MDI3421910.1 thiopeptide-type bacteriocin biosynthesis protein [Streptomyces sp. B-S-A12]